MMPRALIPAVFGVLGLGLVACGGEDNGRPNGARVIAPPVDECEATSAAYDTRDIVRFENIGHTASCESPWGCSFYFNHDDLTVTPNQAGEGPPMVPESELCLSLEPAETDPEFAGAPQAKPAPDGARCGTSTGVMRLLAKNIGQCYGQDGRLGWGASLELKFVAPGNANVIQPLDASDADGIGFWIKRASETANATAMLTVLDAASDGINDSSHPEPHCGCLPNGDGTYSCSSDPSTLPGFPDEAKCDPFGTAFTITEGWSFVAMRFSELTQKGFGFPLAGLDTSGIRRLQLLVNHGSTDFYIDDITLFTDK